jgi:hypothetical protein
MVHINEELKAAEAAINSLSTTPLSKSVFLAALNKANHAAILNLSSGGALNEARGNVGMVLSNLMYGPRTPEKIDAGNQGLDKGIRSIDSSVNVMLLIAQIALGVIIGGLTIALLVTGFLVWNSRQRNERLAVGLFITGAVIVVVLVVVVVSQ